jgi:hypothetical protein
MEVTTNDTIHIQLHVFFCQSESHHKLVFLLVRAGVIQTESNKATAVAVRRTAFTEIEAHIDWTMIQVETSIRLSLLPTKSVDVCFFVAFFVAFICTAGGWLGMTRMWHCTVRLYALLICFKAGAYCTSILFDDRSYGVPMFDTSTSRKYAVSQVHGHSGDSKCVQCQSGQYRQARGWAGHWNGILCIIHRSKCDTIRCL